MTNAVPFDTLAFAKKLEARGINSKDAEAHAEVLAETLEANIATKLDSNAAINNITHEINSLRNEINIKFAEVKSEVIKWVFGISFAQAALIISVLKFFN